MKNSISFDSDLSKFGIGLFETIKIEKEPIDLDLHLDRMFNSIKELDIKIDYNKSFIEKQIVDYIKLENIENKALRLTVFDEGYNISTREIPYTNETYREGFKLTLSPIKRGNSIIYKHKTTNYYENIYTKEYAKKNGCDDGLFVNTNNIVLECSMSNIFFIKENTIYTPNSQLPILNGVMKKRILDICDELNIEIIEKNIKLEELRDYDFVFVTNSLMKAVKVTQIEDIFYSKDNKLFNEILLCI